jgi:hypothetical protein
MKDVGKPKAEVAAERINARVPGVKVTPHFCRIEDMPADFYRGFTVIILGLDSLEARRYMNSVACSLLGAPPRRADAPAGRPAGGLPGRRAGQRLAGPRLWVVLVEPQLEAEGS